MLMASLKSYFYLLKIKLLYKVNLVIRILINNIFLFAFNILLVVITINNIVALPLVIIYNLYLYKKEKVVFIINIIIMIVFILIYLINYFVFSDYNLNSYEGVITNIVYKDDYNKITITNGIKKVLVNHYYEEEFNYNIGDYIKVNGENIIMEENHLPMMFNYKEYLLSKRYISIINVTDVLVSEKINIYYIKRFLYERVNLLSDISKPFVCSLVLGDNSLLEEEINESIRINGISHLFAISGLHINLIVIWVEKIIDRLKIKKKGIVLNLFLFEYLFITSFSFSVFRAVLMNYLMQLNKYFKLKFSSLDICSLSFIIILLINPFSLYNIGFQLSYLVTALIIIFTSYLCCYQGIKQNIMLSLISFLGSIPIAVNINNYINILSPIINIIFVYIITIIVLPLSFIVLLFPSIDIIYKEIINIFILLNDYTSTNISLLIDLPNFNILESLLYYGLILILFNVYNNKKLFKKVIVIFIIFLSIYYHKSSLNLYNEVVFMDLKDGESTLINSSFNNYTILIDTGDGTGNEVTNYLIKKGIRKIDYLIITHNHQDHNGEVRYLLERIEVENIVISIYDQGSYNNQENIIKVKAGDHLNIGNIRLEIISPKSLSNDENDNSLVIYTKLGNWKYLFTGDSSTSVLDKIDIDVDVIKGGHHGSKTSSSYFLYKNCDPKYVILQTGRTKKYNFPDSETIELLDSLNKKVYRTDQDYTITIYYNSFFSYFKCLNE